VQFADEFMTYIKNEEVVNAKKTTMMSIEQEYEAIMEDMNDSVSAHSKRSQKRARDRRHITRSTSNRRASKFSAADINKLKECIVADKGGSIGIRYDSMDSDESISVYEECFSEV